MAPTPNRDGFAAAQERLVDDLGTEVTFYLPPSDPEWPDGTKLDPESGEPYDPTIEPIDDSGDPIEVIKTVGKRIGGLTDEGGDSPIGILKETEGVLIVNEDDIAEIIDAEEVDVLGERYKITRIRPRGLDPAPQALVYIEAK